MKQTKRWLAALVLLVIMFTLTACGEKEAEAPQPTETPKLAVHPIVGVWVVDEETMQQGGTASSRTALEFTSDGRLLMHITSSGGTVTRESTYTVSGNQLTYAGSPGTFSIKGDKMTLVQGGISISYIREK